MRIPIVLVAASLLICIAGRPVHASGEQQHGVVEGDRALLDLLRAAQATGRSSFPQGALDADVRTLRSGDVVEAAAHLIWNDSSTYWDYKQVVKNRGAEPEVSRGEMIETRDSLICFWPEFKLAQIIRDHGPGYRSELRLRPEQIWFGFLGGARAWSDFFDIGTNERAPKVVFDTLAVKSAEDEVVVSRHLNGSVLRIKASLRAGGNVVEYDTTPTASDPMWYRGTYEWAELPDKRWRLKHHEYLFSVRGDNDDPEQRYELTVTAFNPEPVIASDRFRFESLNIPDGTLVEEVSPAGTKSYRKGRKLPTQQERLDELAGALRRTGFAAANEEAPP